MQAQRILTLAAMAAMAALATMTAQAETSVGVAIDIREPGLYGRIELGSGPAPRVVNREALVIRSAKGPRPEPIYMHVPPGHQKNWAKHCARYHACNHPVYFVREDWVNERRAHQGEGKGHGKGHDAGRGKGHDKHRD